MFEDLKLRSISALALLSILFFFAAITPFLLVPSLYLLNILFLYELFNLYGLKKKKLVFNALLYVPCIFPLYFSDTNLPLTIFLNLILFFYILYLSSSRSLSFFVVYVNLALSFLINLISSPTYVGGIGFFIVFVLVVALSDVGGYFGGRLIGGPKVLKQISPSKTWAGIIVGWSLVVLFHQILKSFQFPLFDFSILVFFGIALFSQVGDFIESYIKRSLGVKDTSDIIPGHGGLLDRFDGLICATYFIKIVDLYLVI